MKLFDLFEEKLKTAVIGFGRMNPPTTGHGVLVDAINSKAKEYGGDPMLFLTMTHTPYLTDKTQKLRPWDKVKNPLQWKQKLGYAQKFFDIPISTDPSLNTIMSVMKHLETKGYEKVVLVCGSDRVKEFETQILPYNNTPDQSGNINFNIKEVSVEEGGFRDEEADDASGMSASKMREAAANNDFESFKQGVPVESLAKKMFDDVRQGLGMNHQTEATLVKPMGGAPIKRTNPVAKNANATIGGSGAGAHRDRKKDAKRGYQKHKNIYDSIAEGYNDIEVLGHKYMPDVDEDDDVRKIWHTIVTPQGKTIDADFTPYSYMDKEDLTLYIKLKYPRRKDLGMIGPLDKKDLQKMANNVGVAKLDPEMANAGTKEDTVSEGMEFSEVVVKGNNTKIPTVAQQLGWKTEPSFMGREFTTILPDSKPLTKDAIDKFIASLGLKFSSGQHAKNPFAPTEASNLPNPDSLDWGSMSKREFKRRELEYELDGEEQAYKKDQQGPWYSASSRSSSSLNHITPYSSKKSSPSYVSSSPLNGLLAWSPEENVSPKSAINLSIASLVSGLLSGRIVVNSRPKALGSVFHPNS